MTSDTGGDSRWGKLGHGAWPSFFRAARARMRFPLGARRCVGGTTSAGTARTQLICPGMRVPEQVRVAHEIDEALGARQSSWARCRGRSRAGVYTAAAGRVAPETTSVVSATKGLEPATHKRMSEVIAQVIPAEFAPRVAVLSGPSFALEVARG